MKHLTNSITIILTLLVAAVGGALLVVGMPGSEVKLLTVQTGSMAPAIAPGSAVLVQRVPESTINVGDVLTYISPKDAQQTITHRFVGYQYGENGDKLLTMRGDANDSNDAPVAPTSVVGKVSQTLPFVGYAINFLRTPLGLLLTIYVPTLLVILHEIKLLARRMDEWQIDTVRPKVGLKISSSYGPPHLFVIVALAVPFLITGGTTLAALQSSTTLGAISISTAPVAAPVAPLLIQRVSLIQPDRLASDDASAAVTWRVNLFNPTNVPVSLAGWTIADDSGKVTLLSAVLRPHSSRSFKPDFKNALQYAGDRISLYSPDGQEVDALSWGTDKSRLQPALPALSPALGTFVRIDSASDTDTSADWKITK